MTKQQEKLLEIMYRFDNLCELNDAAYYLIGAQLFHAVKDGKIHGYEIDVAMFIEDWDKMRKVGEQTEGIEIESPEDMGLLPACYYRWVDSNTLLLDLDRYKVLSKPGIGINIHIIRKKGWNPVLYCYEREMRRVAANKSKMPEALLSDVNRRMAMRSAMKFFRERCANRNTEETALMEQRGRRVRLKGVAWSERTKVYLEEMPLYTLSNYQDYLAERYGENWQNKRKSDCITENYRCIFSTSLPYKKYIDVAKQGILNDEFVESAKRYGFEFEEYKKMKRAEDDGWTKTMFAAGERFRLWKKYMPEKETLRELFRDGKFGEAEIIMQDYIDTAEEYIKKNVAICFDTELFDKLRYLFLINGRERIYERLTENVVPEDLKGITKTW